CAVLSPDSSRKGKFKDNSSRSNFYRHLRDFHKDEMETAAQRNETFGELMATAFAVNLIPFNVIDSKEMRAALQYADLKVIYFSKKSLICRPRNVKKVRVKPIKSMGDYSSEDESHSDSSGLDEESEGEMEMMKESLGRFRKAAKDHQAEIEADRIDNVTTSRSKRGRDATKQS
ncbi:hypothetical protein PMAYCL1PPCAC_20582, partial [Pristionchus mayeri]